MMISWLLGCTWIFHIFWAFGHGMKENNQSFQVRFFFSIFRWTSRCAWRNMCLGQPHGKMTNRYPNNRRAFEKRQLNWKTSGDLRYLFVKKKVPIGHIPTSFFTARRFFFDTRNFGNRALTGHQLFGNLGTVGCRGVGECVSQKNPT